MPLLARTKGRVADELADAIRRYAETIDAPARRIENALQPADLVATTSWTRLLLA